MRSLDQIIRSNAEAALTHAPAPYDHSRARAQYEAETRARVAEAAGSIGERAAEILDEHAAWRKQKEHNLREVAESGAIRGGSFTPITNDPATAAGEHSLARAQYEAEGIARAAKTLREVTEAQARAAAKPVSLDSLQISAMADHFRRQGRYVMLARIGIRIVSIETFTTLDDAFDAASRHQRSDPHDASCSILHPITSPYTTGA